MALTPEQVKTQTFTITKFRDGYEPDQVDDFLDEIVADLEARDAERAQLQQQIAELTAEVKQLRDQAGAPQQTVAVPEVAAAPTAVSAADAQKSSAMLQLALELHDKHVREGETKRAQLISEAETEASRLVREATKQREDQLRRLSAERANLEAKINDLEEFEKEYRSTLRSYIQSQLKGLDGKIDVNSTIVGN